MRFTCKAAFLSGRHRTRDIVLLKKSLSSVSVVELCILYHPLLKELQNLTHRASSRDLDLPY